MLAQLCQIQGPAQDDRRHAGSAFAARYANAVDGRVLDAGKCRDGCRDLGRCHVLTLPAERIADPVDEIKESGFVHAHKVAGAKPGVARFEYVAKDFLLSVLALSVAFEHPGRL